MKKTMKTIAIFMGTLMMITSCSTPINVDIDAPTTVNKGNENKGDENNNGGNSNTPTEQTPSNPTEDEGNGDENPTQNPTEPSTTDEEGNGGNDNENPTEDEGNGDENSTTDEQGNGGNSNTPTGNGDENPTQNPTEQTPSNPTEDEGNGDENPTQNPTENNGILAETVNSSFNDLMFVVYMNNELVDTNNINKTTLTDGTNILAVLHSYVTFKFEVNLNYQNSNIIKINRYENSNTPLSTRVTNISLDGNTITINVTFN